MDLLSCPGRLERPSELAPLADSRWQRTLKIPQQQIPMDTIHTERNMSASTTPLPSWDDTQLAAVLVTCARCGRSYYMTVVGPLCQRCRG